MPPAPRVLAALARWTPAQWVATIVALGVLLRAVLVLTEDFPLNDGALFLEMARAVQAAHYHLPRFVVYNGTNIPFGYSPFGFYLVAALHDVLGLDMIQALRVLPLIATCACIAAFAAFARDLLPRVTVGVTRAEPALVGAVLAFALLPRSFVWLLMGGGLTRSLGFLFAILAIHHAYLFYVRGRWSHALLTGVFAGLTVMSHIGTAPFAACSIALMFAAYGRHRVGVLGSALALAITLALVAPWVTTVVGYHGWDPFLAARATGGNAFSDSLTRYTVSLRLAEFGVHDNGEVLFPLITVLAFFGALASARAGQLLLPVWWGLILLLDARAPGTYATVPIALLTGIALAAVVWPLLFPGPAADRAVAVGDRRRAGWAPWLVAAALFAYALAGAATRNESVNGENKLLRGLPANERAAMAWVQRATPRDARFVVLTGPGHTGIWGDRVSEWFPVLAGRVSVATIQGREWINDGTFKRRELEYGQLQSCVARNAGCLDAWSQATAAPFTHVFVSKERSFAKIVQPLASALRADPGFTILYDGPGGLVAERRPQAPPLPAAHTSVSAASVPR